MSNDHDRNGFLRLVLTGTCASLVSAVILHCCTADGLQGLVAFAQSIIGKADAPGSNTDKPREVERKTHRSRIEEIPEPELKIPTFKPQLAPIQFSSLPDPFLAQPTVNQRAPDAFANALLIAPDPAKELGRQSIRTKKEEAVSARLTDSPNYKSGMTLREELGELQSEKFVPIATKETEPKVSVNDKSITPTTEPVTRQESELIAKNETAPIPTKDGHKTVVKKSNSIPPRKTDVLTPEEKHRIARSRKSIFHWLRERKAYLTNSSMRSEAKK